MIRVGLIGTGYIGPVHLDALSRLGGVKVTRVADTNATLAAQACARFNIEQHGTDWREVVADPSIDVIHNCTPNKFHYEINRAALEAGKQVLSEKPLAMTVEEAEDLVALADRKKAVVGLDFCYRYYPIVQEMAARVRRGDAGTVRFVTGSFLQDWLSRETDWTWRLLPSESGDSSITADLGSHWFDLVQYVTGLEVCEVIGDLATLIPVRRRPVRQVLAFEQVGAIESEEVRVELEDYSAVLFRLSSGAPGSFTTCQLSPGRKSDTEFQIYGSKCSLAWNHKDATRLWIGYRERPNEDLIENATLQDPASAKYATLPAGHPQGYYDAVLNLFRHYYEAVRKGDPAGTDRPTFKNGLAEMKILSAVLESHRKRQWIRVPA
jgi:predicted dehydrogenase